jgi:hypothetical protein
MVDIWFSLGTLEERQEMAVIYLPRFPRWHDLTWMVDGTHCPVCLYPTRGEIEKEYWSFKLKQAALNTQVRGCYGV